VNAKSRLQAVLILITVFISGGLLGVAVDRQMVPTEAEVQESGEEEQGEERRTRERIVDQVGLSEVQKVQVDSIVDTARVRMDEARQDLREQYEAAYRQIVLETREAIKTVLSVEQAMQYDSLLAERDARRAARRNEDNQRND
jgi:Spy/CpxP family protein refolding chaperone